MVKVDHEARVPVKRQTIRDTGAYVYDMFYYEAIKSEVISCPFPYKLERPQNIL